jgi:hypothetical protein
MKNKSSALKQPVKRKPPAIHLIDKPRPHLPIPADMELRLRQRIANAARYHERMRSVYSVNWCGKLYLSNDTGDLVDQVIADLSKECAT